MSELITPQKANTHSIPDQLVRERALSMHNSFIVQAPAGSGKTELLVQRFLILLAQATQSPEEILAITFTRKAAAEMRHRILHALHSAADSTSVPIEPHALKTRTLAEAVLQQNLRLKWNLLNNPQRLRILTIDAFCLSLTRRMPLLAGLSPKVKTIDNAKDYYLIATRRLLSHLAAEQKYAQKLVQLQLHLDNRIDVIEQLFINILARRDQWLPHLVVHRKNLTSNEFRSVLQAGLHHIVQEYLLKCFEMLAVDADELMYVLRYAAENLSVENPDHPVYVCRNLTEFPLPLVENHSVFVTITQFLLTQKNTWRRTVDKRDGFPADNKPLKARMMALLQQLNGNEVLRVNLENLRLAPPVTYSTEQWEILNIITDLLPLLAAQLTLIFSEQNVVDFSEVSMAALRALDEQDSPTDLALMLDYQLKHLLIDEFQDTSIMQYRLLEKLTAGWQFGDGKTLFLVGDPMQSIYRFRQAEVGLFLKAQQEGIGAVSLEPLVLQTNFRSTTTIVNWINHNFQAIFPQHTDISSGAVPYNSSIAIKNMHDHSQVLLHTCLNTQPIRQEEKILTLIQQEIAENPQHTIAILVRSRKHLAKIIPLLKQANINFSAVEIESLAQQSIIHDLLALTRALLHLSDKIAWLAVLRAPWCGLTLKDLHVIANASANKPLWYTLQNFEKNSALSVDAQQRLAHLVPILSQAISQRGRLKLRAWLEHTWRAVKGDSCVETPAELSAAQTYFELVEKIADTAILPDISVLEAEVAQRYATPEIVSDCKVHLMTIHKAKGLEFDVVILPHLQSRGRHNDEQLLLWLDRPRANGENDLILAPIKAKKDTQDAIYHYLQHVEKLKTAFEITRVLYVATTRAKKSLHLLADLNVSDGKLKEPDKNSFLSLLWTPFKIAAEKILTTETYAEPAISPPVVEQKLRRISSAYFLTTPIPTIALNSSSDFRFDWPDDMPRHIGTVVHRCLQQIANEGISNWHTTKIHTEHLRWQKWLLQLGLNGASIPDSIILINQIISKTLEDPIGRWVLAENHLEQNNEFPLTTMIEGVATHILIDRTFVDDEGVRWIIDYKTSALTTENKEDFLQQAKQQHQEQLKKYADALRYLDTRPIRLGLYFPAFSGWIDWV